MGMRIGQGFDAHRFVSVDSGDGGCDGDGPATARELWLAGLRWDDGSVAIEGDSDGDVAVHALIDAFLAASGLGDIGSLFGVGKDSCGAGMHGADMLRDTIDYLRSHGFVPCSASVAIIGNRPKIGPRRAEAATVLSDIAGCPVSVTATTTDHMGFTGRGEGIAAIANALVDDAPVRDTLVEDE
ncbi:2-C-methyl-D-erythritol 2,4-cyclodiphosphate synthase [Bifidobacterium merycicum]|uniref:2-C-methyl-D-erythritol 2,4-cyclodiphosphate synthase n=1 Tax=Bifidobacterium merycicum TaxID=78345 RepID=A0A087BKX3_9BIFI|nr:2-C-methyl-D-erythritol 2,4-cyclodiphosphate synthase [Bifidobacterium merycicum]KFI71673.1 2-C-methyl-D-erythritol 2,4-cyclodiphosphate synthase [Bifidobacterium merycicum]MBQ1513168.1 2-C-methyl-D-erythritol 2,4-cyclodiphosphate synthase [Bifidobacterium sp.]SHE46876.1 2-C-methyl-D-erythritol 2,4-cyclodiphosphate synthase [Bifidobacterium merycicum DSM 6492]